MKIKRRYTIEDAKKGLLPLDFDEHKIVEVLYFSKSDCDFPIIALTEKNIWLSFSRECYWSGDFNQHLEIEEEVSLGEYIDKCYDEYYKTKNWEPGHKNFLKWYIENKQGK